MLYAVVVCPFVCLSVTRQYYPKMAKHRIMQTTPYNNLGMLLSDAKYLSEIPTKSPQWGRQIEVG